MTALELRAIAYAAAIALFVAIGVHIGMRHVQAQWNIDKLATAAVIEKQESDLIAAQKARDNLQTQVEATHAQILSNGATLSASLTDSMRAVEAAIRAGTVHGSMANPGGLQVTVPSNGGDARLTSVIERVNASIAGLANACIKVDADRTAIIALEPR